MNTSEHIIEPDENEPDELEYVEATEASCLTHKEDKVIIHRFPTPKEMLRMELAKDRYRRLYDGIWVIRWMLLAVIIGQVATVALLLKLLM